MIISGVQFIAEVSALGFRCIGPRDPKLFCPSEAWLKEFAVWIAANRVPGQANVWDCEDISMRATTDASLSGLAAGLNAGHTFCYVAVRLWGMLNGIDPDGQGISGHVTNLVRLDDGRILFFEPQTGIYCDAKTAIDSGDVTPVDALL